MKALLRLLGLWSLLMACVAPAAAQALQRMDLGGAWEFRETQGKAWLPAQVPGTVHTDLLAAGIIRDPFFGNQPAELAWIEQLDWEYRRSFVLADSTLRHGQVDLVLDGIDTYADVEVNGQHVGTTDNMHRRWRLACKPFLRLGANEVVVRLRSPLHVAGPQAAASPYRLPADSDKGQPAVAPYVRKAAYHFGWDFAPRMVTSGIWRDIALEAWSGARIAAVLAVPTRMDPAEVPVRVSVEVDVAESGKYDFDLLLDGALVVSSTRELERGQRMVSLAFDIHGPEFWWPRGMGDPKRYRLTARIQRAQETLHSHDQALGLRSIRLVREQDAIGTSFYFSINDFLPGRGGPLYIKGANMVPLDAFLPRGRAQLRSTLEAAQAVGMNMLRIWGGGVYADDALYDWADAHGMLIWQDLAFAGMMYPLEGEFLKNVNAEVAENVKRLRHHPSLAIWCGNNEMDVAWKNWGWQQSLGYSADFAAKLWRQYQAFFEREVPNQLNVLDPGRAYIPSSPLSNWGKEENFNHHNMHYWGVWHGADSLDGFAKYVPRFMTEYGFQSWPSADLLRAYVPPAAWGLQSPTVVQRQLSYKGNAPILRFLEPAYGKPRDLDAFCRLSQLVQRDAMDIAIKAHRMRQPHCMGTMYWQLNDVWPGPSWSTIEADGRWKPAHYALKRLYAPVLLSLEVTRDSLFVSVAHDGAGGLYHLGLRLKNLEGEALAGHDASISVRPGGGSYLRLPLAALRTERDPAHHFVEAVLYQGRREVAADLAFFGPPRQLDLPDPAYSYQVTADGEGYTLTLTSKTLVKDLEIQVVGMEAQLSENFIDLAPGRPRQIRIAADAALGAEGLTRRLHFSDLTKWMGQ